MTVVYSSNSQTRKNSKYTSCGEFNSKQTLKFF